MTATGFIDDITVEFAFGLDAVGGDYLVLDDPIKGELGNSSYPLAPDTVWVDAGPVGEGIAAVAISRGREREIDEYTTGTATVLMYDNDREWDPANSAATYYGELEPMRKIRIRYGNTPLFVGWVDDWQIAYRPGDNLAEITVPCVDSFALLANEDLDEISAAHTGDMSGERVDRVLDLAEVAFGAGRSIDTGLSTFGNTTLGENALAYLQRCARAEAGYLFVDRAGVLQFKDRHTTLNRPSGADLVDGHSATSGIPYVTLGQSSARDLLFNRVTGKSETTDTDQEANDTASQDAYNISTLPLGTLLNLADGEVEDLLDWHLQRLSQPELRFTDVTLNVGALSQANLELLLGLELTDVVTVYRTPLGAGSEISRTSIVDRIDHTITPGEWHMSLGVSNADTRSYFVLDDPVLGVLGANRLAM